MQNIIALGTSTKNTTQVVFPKYFRNVKRKGHWECCSFGPSLAFFSKSRGPAETNFLLDRLPLRCGGCHLHLETAFSASNVKLKMASEVSLRI